MPALLIFSNTCLVTLPVAVTITSCQQNKVCMECFYEDDFSWVGNCRKETPCVITWWGAIKGISCVDFGRHGCAIPCQKKMGNLSGCHLKQKWETPVVRFHEGCQMAMTHPNDVFYATNTSKQVEIKTGVRWIRPNATVRINSAVEWVRGVSWKPGVPRSKQQWRSRQDYIHKPTPQPGAAWSSDQPVSPNYEDTRQGGEKWETERKIERERENTKRTCSTSMVPLGSVKIKPMSYSRSSLRDTIRTSTRLWGAEMLRIIMMFSPFKSAGSDLKKTEKCQEKQVGTNCFRENDIKCERTELTKNQGEPQRTWWNPFLNRIHQEVTLPGLSLTAVSWNTDNTEKCCIFVFPAQSIKTVHVQNSIPLFPWRRLLHRNNVIFDKVTKWRFNELVLRQIGIVHQDVMLCGWKFWNKKSEFCLLCFVISSYFPTGKLQQLVARSLVTQKKICSFFFFKRRGRAAIRLSWEYGGPKSAYRQQRRWR